VTLDSMDYRSFIFVANQAGMAEARNATPEFHHSAAGYGRYYLHTYAHYADENLWVEFFAALGLGGHPKAAIDGHLKTGQ